jgi:hypothetical protein
MVYSDATRIDINTGSADAAVRAALRAAIKAFGDAIEDLYVDFPDVGNTDNRNQQAFMDQLIDLTRWLSASLR